LPAVAPRRSLQGHDALLAALSFLVHIDPAFDRRIGPDMHRLLTFLAAAAFLATPAQAQTTRWSDNLALPSPGGSRSAPAPVRPQAPGPGYTQQWSAPGYTRQWSAPTYTRQRTDAENRAIVDRMAERARRDARQGRGAGLDLYQRRSAPNANVPKQVWQDHIARDRANEAFRRNEDAYYSRQGR
jgi:hypothetical protein